MVEIETGSIIPIWRTFGRIQCHVIPEPRATLQGERIPSAILKIVFRRILFFVFLMQFGLWRAAAFVSSSIHFVLYQNFKGHIHLFEVKLFTGVNSSRVQHCLIPEIDIAASKPEVILCWVKYRCRYFEIT